MNLNKRIDRKLYLTSLPGERESPWKGSEKQHEKDKDKDEATQPSTNVNVNVNVRNKSKQVIATIINKRMGGGGMLITSWV